MQNNIVFNPKTYQLLNLINDIETGNIALPELQRPFVWKQTKARDLMDSLYKGLPVGLIILWEILEPGNYKKINQEDKRDPRFLVIDGQQRLTSLFSVIKGKDVILKNVKKAKIKISFNPIEERFEVYNPAIGKDAEWIPDISRIFEIDSTFSLVKEYIENLKEKQINISEGEIANRIERVRNILNYPLSVLELSTELDPEEVSEIFVRINSKGQTLNQSDFILTLMSVYWPAGREALEDFCKQSHQHNTENNPTSFNLIHLKPTPEQLIRTIVGYAFKRGRLKYAYLILKGRDLENRTVSEKLRTQNFEIFKNAQEAVLDLTNWHNYIKIIHSSGFVSHNLISSQIALYITYAFYLLGVQENKNDFRALETAIKRWFVFSILTQRYTGSPESTIEEDFGKIKKGGVISFVNHSIALQFTDDFWNILLPEKLESSSTKNFAFLTYTAAQIFFDKKILFSDIKIKDYMNPFITSKKKTIELHHIFPKNYLKKTYQIDKKEINQVANLIYIEYRDNIKIKDRHPGDYWYELVGGFPPDKINHILKEYDLPENFYNMSYEDFLARRRQLMANMIKEYFGAL